VAKTSTFRIEGAKELERWMLKELPAKLARTSTLAGMRSAAKPMVMLAKVKVPVRSGALRQAIGIRTVPSRGGVTQSSGIPFTIGNAEDTFAAIEIGPLTGTSGAGLNAWARYRAFYGGPNLDVTTKKGRIGIGMIGRIRHGHLMEFGFTHTSGKQVPPQRFLAPAFNGGFPIYRRRFVADVRKKVEDSIRKHNAKSRLRR